MQAVAERITRAVRAERLPSALQKVAKLDKIRNAVLAETAASMVAGRQGGFTVLVSPNDKKFRLRHQNWKQALLALCTARIAQAEAELLEIVDEAKARLARYGYHDNETLEADVVVRRARRKLAGLQSRLQRIDSDPPDEAWQQHVGALLSDK